MNNTNIFKHHGKTMIVLALCLCIPFILIWYMTSYVNKNIFYEQKGDYLMAIAKVLDSQLADGGYDEILAEAGVKNASPEEQIAALHEALRDITDEVAQASDGLGVGYYSRELDVILTYGPSADYQHTVGTPIGETHPGRRVMSTGNSEVVMGSMVRGNIMNAMLPIVRNNEVIGYIWANELVSELEGTLSRMSTIILLLLVLSYIVMLVIIMMFIRRMIKTEQASTQAVSKALEETQSRDRLMRIVNDAVFLLLTADGETFETALQDCMQMMGNAFKVDQICIWRISGGQPTGESESESKSESKPEPEYNCAASWHSEACRKAGCGFVFGPDELSGIQSLSGWRELLMRRESVRSDSSGLSKQELSLISPTGALSLLALPVFLQDKNWGFVVFCDLHDDRSLDTGEEAVLLSGSLLMANAIARNEIMRHMARAHEEALAGTRAKSAFLASMSHEIRTPMNAIIGMVAIGRASEIPDRKDYAFDKIKTASTHLLHVINDVLDISKIESGKLEISPVTFRFSEMIRRVKDVVSPRMEEKNQIFTVNMDTAIPNILVADDQRLTQVIINLLSNSCKFTPEGGHISFLASLEKHNDTDATIKISVSDDGIGISPEQQERIFNSFEQAESSTTRKYGGTGLGLAISKNIIELMGGRIWLESDVGKGSIFSFVITVGYLPASRETDEQIQTAGNKSNKGNKHEDLLLGSDFSGRHILLAEDVEINREILITVLEPTNLKIDCAENGVEAVRMFRENPEKYDLILMDVQMPEMDGYEATRKIRAMSLPNAATIPVIAATANVFKEDVEKCLAAGMNGHVGKPLDIDEVLSVLKKYLS